LQAGLAQIGCPAVLKTAVSGYDGKGQIKLNHPDEATACLASRG
jgi:5-(carboxyamino)imidazole ribonucleotide synthase